MPEEPRTVALARRTTTELAEYIDDAMVRRQTLLPMRRAIDAATGLGLLTSLGMTAVFGLSWVVGVVGVLVVLSVGIVLRQRFAPEIRDPEGFRDAYERASRLVDHGQLEPEQEQTMLALLDAAREYVDS